MKVIELVSSRPEARYQSIHQHENDGQQTQHEDDNFEANTGNGDTVVHVQSMLSTKTNDNQGCCDGDDDEEAPATVQQARSLRRLATMEAAQQYDNNNNNNNNSSNNSSLSILDSAEVRSANTFLLNFFLLAFLVALSVALGSYSTPLASLFSSSSSSSNAANQHSSQDLLGNIHLSGSNKNKSHHHQNYHYRHHYHYHGPPPNDKIKTNRYSQEEEDAKQQHQARANTILTPQDFTCPPSFTNDNDRSSSSFVYPEIEQARMNLNGLMPESFRAYQNQDFQDDDGLYVSGMGTVVAITNSITMEKPQYDKNGENKTTITVRHGRVLFFLWDCRYNEWKRLGRSMTHLDVFTFQRTITSEKDKYSPYRNFIMPEAFRGSLYIHLSYSGTIALISSEHAVHCLEWNTTLQDWSPRRATTTRSSTTIAGPQNQQASVENLLELLPSFASMMKRDAENEDGVDPERNKIVTALSDDGNMLVISTVAPLDDDNKNATQTCSPTPISVLEYVNSSHSTTMKYQPRCRRVYVLIWDSVAKQYQFLPNAPPFLQVNHFDNPRISISTTTTVGSSRNGNNVAITITLWDWLMGIERYRLDHRRDNDDESLPKVWVKVADYAPHDGETAKQQMLRDRVVSFPGGKTAYPYSMLNVNENGTRWVESYSQLHHANADDGNNDNTSNHTTQLLAKEFQDPNNGELLPSSKTILSHSLENKNHPEDNDDEGETYALSRMSPDGSIIVLTSEQRHNLRVLYLKQRDKLLACAKWQQSDVHDMKQNHTSNDVGTYYGHNYLQLSRDGSLFFYVDEHQILHVRSMTCKL